MELIATCGERREKVTVERRGDAVEVTVGERRYLVDDASTPGGGLHSLLLDGRQYAVRVRRETSSRYRVLTRGRNEVVEVVDPLTALAEAAGAGRGGPRQEEVTAYMPGKVSAVLVAEGDTVRSGQGVVVLEAMKMENEILAPHDGVVRRVHVAPGQAVEGGDPLFTLE